MLQDKTVDALATIRPTEEVRVDVAKWLQGDPKHSYKVWRQHMPARGPDTPTTKPVKKVLKMMKWCSRNHTFF